MDRLNSEGINRDQLIWTLRNPRLVLSARRINSCLLCRRIGVNEAALCEVCYALISDPEEQRLINNWMTVGGP